MDKIKTTRTTTTGGLERTSPGLTNNNNNNNKTCSVCGDKALGYNFNAITCESCKAFFRRNALSNKDFNCPFSDDCKVTVITRRFCQKCRLQKCFEIGMKKEYIMSEEDKVMKRKKIEQNRAKKRLSPGVHNHNQQTTTTMNSQSDDNSNRRRQSVGDNNYPVKIKREGSHIITTSDINNIDNNSWSTMSSSSPSSSFLDDPISPSSSGISISDGCITSTTNHYSRSVTIESSPSEMINAILNSKFGSKNVIDRLMKTQTDAVFVMSKIFNSQPDALELLGHLIEFPGDALHIISKIMNSPLDALTVFTKFMSSPTDAIQIIGKIVSSPSDVLQFMHQLMNCPEDALQIMNKFMNSPIEALKIINRMINSTTDVIPDQNGENGGENGPAIDENKNGVDDQTENESIQNGRNDDDTTSLVKVKLLKKHDSDSNISMFDSILENFDENVVTADELDDESMSNNSHVDDNDNDEQIDIMSPLQSTEEIISDIVSDIQHQVIQSNSLDSFICDAIRMEYETFDEDQISSYKLKQLNSRELEKIKELITANEALYDPVDDEFESDACIMPQTNPNQQNPDLLKVINLTAVAVRRLIKMSKKVTAFKNMCQEDQLALLKGGCIEMMIMRSVMQYDEDQNTFTVPHRNAAMGIIKADVLKLAKGTIYEKIQLFVSNFDKKWRKDVNIVPIMCAITLFSPNRPRTIHTDVIKLEQTSYFCLLQRYLASIYPGCEAKSTFLKLIQKIHDLQRLNEEVINVYLDVNPSQIEPLLIEIFDLKAK